MTKLAIGTGGQTDWYRQQGFVTLDADPLIQADRICEVPPLPDLGVLDHVEAIHFWEHLYLWQAEELAKQIYAALRLGGKLVLELPDLYQCCAYICGIKSVPIKDSAPYQPDPRYTEWGIFGAQSDPTWAGNLWQVHKWGYTHVAIVDHLKAAGFGRVTVMTPMFGQPERDMRVEAVK